MNQTSIFEEERSRRARTTVRDTSIEAYKNAIARGTIRKLTKKVLEILFDQQRPMTGNEIAKLMPKYGEHSMTAQRNVHSVVSKMKERDLLEEYQKRPCETSGEVAWPVYPSGRQPVKVKRGLSKDEKIEKLRASILKVLRYINFKNAANASPRVEEIFEELNRVHLETK